MEHTSYPIHYFFFLPQLNVFNPWNQEKKSTGDNNYGTSKIKANLVASRRIMKCSCKLFSHIASYLNLLWKLTHDGWTNHDGSSYEEQLKSKSSGELVEASEIN